MGCACSTVIKSKKIQDQKKSNRKYKKNAVTESDEILDLLVEKFLDEVYTYVKQKFSL